MSNLSDKQIHAICDAYTTLRATCRTYGETDDVLGTLCAESCQLLVEAFAEVDVLQILVDYDIEEKRKS